MPDPFLYLLSHDSASQTQGNTSNDLLEFTATTATFTDSGSTCNSMDTPSPTDDGINIPTDYLEDKNFQGMSGGRMALPEPAGTPSTPEPTVLLNQIQQAAEDVSQLVGRFGYKMAKAAQIFTIKRALFADHKLLRLPCLKYADNFTCKVTKLHAKQPINYTKEAPLLWWLWDELLNYLEPSGFAQGCKLEFTPAAYPTDIVIPYKISINLSYKNGTEIIELTASYGGQFHERRIFEAPIARFRLPETRRYGKSTIATLNIDRHVFKEEGCLARTLDYLVPRPDSIWRHAMEAFPAEQEETLMVNLAETCKAEDDHSYMSETQAQQCLNLLQRFPADAKEYISKEGLVGKKKGPYSRMANRSFGPKD